MDDSSQLVRTLEDLPEDPLQLLRGWLAEAAVIAVDGSTAVAVQEDPAIGRPVSSSR